MHSAHVLRPESENSLVLVDSSYRFTEFYKLKIVELIEYTFFTKSTHFLSLYGAHESEDNKCIDYGKDFGASFFTLCHIIYTYYFY